MFILLNKPYGMLSQFSHQAGTRWTSLRDIPLLPAGIYPAGRLDAESEGLLLLTDDMKTRHRLLDPASLHPRTYLAQVEGIPDPRAIHRLESGTILLDGRRVLPAIARLLPDEPDVPPRAIPIRYRASIPTAWVELTLREGRNRQVRRMTAAAGHPTLRLIRTAIGSLLLDDLPPGAWREVSAAEVISSLAAQAAQERREMPGQKPRRARLDRR
jgi:23S rRNA pseudouridine2457 synthase